MLARSAFRASAAQALVARRGFHNTRLRLGHYPEGPRSNIPFNPLTRFFYLRFMLFCGTGFGIPFAIAYWQLHKNK